MKLFIMNAMQKKKYYKIISFDLLSNNDLLFRLNFLLISCNSMHPKGIRMKGIINMFKMTYFANYKNENQIKQILDSFIKESIINN